MSQSSTTKTPKTQSSTTGIMLFLIFCIGARLSFVYAAAKYTEYLPIFGTLAIILAIGFMYFYTTGTRKTGPEVFGGEIWWNHLRPVHATLYTMFAVCALNKNPNSWMFLAADVAVGLVSFLDHHFMQQQ
jgi:hypothetical protein